MGSSLECYNRTICPWEERASSNLVRLIVIWSFRSHSDTSNPDHYNPSDERPRFIHLIKKIIAYKDVATYPLNLSESEGLRLNLLLSRRSDASERAMSLL